MPEVPSGPPRPAATTSAHRRGETMIEWRHEQQRTPWQGFAHFWIVTARGFVRNRCPVHATALAYASLLALVPMLAVVASISTSLLRSDGDEAVSQLVERFVTIVTPVPEESDGGVLQAQGQELLAARREMARRVHEFVGNVHSGTLGLTGSLALVVVAILMLARIEDTFNDIWGVTRGRSWFARIVQYWAAITLGPALLILALGLTTGPHLLPAREWLESSPLLATLVFHLLPFALLIMAFALFYQLMPNTRVQWRAAILGGLVGGFLWQLNNVVSVLYVSRVVAQSKIYGSLGLVPVLMMGLYISWLILLFGSQVAYTIQNRQTYLEEQPVESVHQLGRELIALRLMTCVAQHFLRAAPPPGNAALATALGVPSQLTAQLLQPLVQGGLLLEVAGPETTYALARPPARITCHDVLFVLRTSQGQEPTTSADPDHAAVEDAFDRIQRAESKAADGITIESLATGVTPADVKSA